VGPEIGLLIPTRNRPRQVAKLLQSVASSLTKPEQIVIVASGESITNVILQFKDVLSISYLHINERGQIRQKMLGIQEFRSSIDWIFFCDDDLLFESATLNLLRSRIMSISSDNVVGIGTNLVDFSLKISTNNFEKVMKKLKLFKYGKVTKSGKNNFYMDSSNMIETEWLNGASIWRRQVAETYHFPYLEARYSICEDLIFSYKAGKEDKLIFDPSIRLRNQEDFSEFSYTEIEIATFVWKVYFLSENSSISPVFFYFREGFLIAKKVIRFRKSRIEFPGLISVVRIYLEAIIRQISNKPPLDFLTKYQ
jgi:glycosyltransferase involved in cell wall biosynthesis